MLVTRITHDNSRAAALTLIELLVVIAILGVLCAVVARGWTSVREAGLRMTCAANLRTTAVLISQFTADNNGHGPGSAHCGPPGWPTGASFAWVDILNEEVNDCGFSLTKMGATRLGCPRFNPPPTTYRRCFTYNLDASGGQASSAGIKPYGKRIVPATLRGAKFDDYWLGANYGRFANPSAKVLVRENERTADYASGGNGTITLGDDPQYPAWSGNGGTWSFRHAALSANVLFVDLHLGTTTARTAGELNTGSHFNLNAQ